MTQPADDDISHLDFDFELLPEEVAQPDPAPAEPPYLGNVLNPAQLGKQHAPSPDRAIQGRSVKAHTETVEGNVYTVSFLVPANLQLRPDFDDMVHDEGLAHAHFKNLMPVGPTFTTVEDADDVPDYQMQDLARQMPSNLSHEQALAEAERLAGRKAQPMKQILITVSMQIGAQM